MSVAIRAATEADAGGILAIARELVADGTTYLFAPETTDDGLGAYWLDARARRFVAVVDGDVAGCYLLRPNQPGRGSHVANASYAVARRFAGRGIGRAMGEHSLGEARRLGFTAMQFNFVVSTNEAAVGLWRKLGFRIVGELPKAFRHPTLGLVDAYVGAKHRPAASGDITRHGKLSGLLVPLGEPQEIPVELRGELLTRLGAGIASHLRAHGVREAKVLRDFEAWRKARRSHRRRR